MAERLIELEIRGINNHLPKARISLKEALGSGSPGVETRSGSFHSIRKDELVLLSELMPERMQGELMLPILIWMDRKLGNRAAAIKGRAEVKAVSALLGKNAEGEEMVIYGPEVATLRNRLPTATQYAFSG